MKSSAGQKAHQPVNGIFHITFISILSFFIFCSPGYGSTDNPDNVNTAQVAIEAAALFAGFGGGSGLGNQGIFNVANANIGATDVSTFVTGFRDEEGAYPETQLDIGTESETTRTAHPACQDSCSL